MFPQKPLEPCDQIVVDGLQRRVEGVSSIQIRTLIINHRIWRIVLGVDILSTMCCNRESNWDTLQRRRLMVATPYDIAEIEFWISSPWI